VSPRDLLPGDLPEGNLPATLRPPARRKPSILLLVAMTGIGPFTMQIVIPSLPAMALALAVPYGTIQLAITLYLIGVALAQLLYGPLSDRFGRKPLLLAGLSIFLVGSVAAALAPSAGFLIAARVLQAVGSCAGLVLGRAIIRDAYPREQAASMMGYVSTAMSVAPMLAPLLGSLLEQRFGWRASMVACLAFGVPLWLAVRARLPETLAQPAPLPGLAGMLGAYAQLVRLPAFRAYCGITAFSTGAFFAFAVGGPLVVVQTLGYAPTAYAAAMMLIALSWSAGTFTVARLATRLGVPRMLRLGTRVTLVGGVLAVAVELLLPPGLWPFFLPMVVVAVGNGMTQPNAIAAAVSVRPGLAGTASGLVGSLQMGFGALLTVLVGLTETGSGLPTALGMLGCAIGTQVYLAKVRRLKA